MKYKRIIICLLISISSIIICYFTFNTINNYTNTKELIAYIDIPAPPNTYNIVEKKGDIDDELIAIANKEINKLPEEIINKFIELEWSIHLTDENISENYFDNKYSSVIGVTIFKDKTILISAREDSIKEALLHEMGHFVDYITGYTSSSDYFINNIYNIEVEEFKDLISNSTCVSNEHEFFAEEFSYLFRNHHKSTELASTYIKDIIKDI